jgi:carbon-monoxide dehydrogenase large subunit
MASRSTVTLSGALFHASERLREKVFSIAANILECAPADVELRDGGVGVIGVPGGAPGATLSLARIARAAMPGWSNERPQGVDAGLEETFYWQPSTVTWSYAAHVAIVEVDPETGRVRIDDYAVAHDCGNVVNPMLVEGQIMGGAVQGLGGILCEAIAYDANGQLLSGSLMDYAMPIAADMPAMKIVHLHSPSPLNPLGVKGVGEGGAVAPPAAIANAVCDALAMLNLEINATPVRPEQIAKLARGLRR